MVVFVMGPPSSAAPWSPKLYKDFLVFSWSWLFVSDARVVQHGVQHPAVAPGGGRQCSKSADANTFPGVMHS